MLFKDYQLSVREDYETKKANNDLSIRLITPTAAKLRDECAAVCEERYARKDEETLRTFFGKQENPTAYIRTIKIENPDRFRPLLNFLKDKVSDPDYITVELLAWLINFEPRPYKSGIGLIEVKGKLAGNEVQNIKEEGNTTAAGSDGSGDDDSNSGGRGNTRSKFKIQMAVLLTVFIISSGTGTYWLLNHTQADRRTIPGSEEGCMYWAGDHYQVVPCNQKFKDGTLVIGLDSEKLNHFKKITIPDTITERSKGSVWYAKIDNKIEFYTAGGTHPVHVERVLKPITDYIISKYIPHNQRFTLPPPSEYLLSK